ncbi:MAG: DUF2232 domain-containing protein [Cyanobacteria bacterium P01_A01_bin.135]
MTHPREDDASSKPHSAAEYRGEHRAVNPPQRDRPDAWDGIEDALTLTQQDNQSAGSPSADGHSAPAFPASYPTERGTSPQALVETAFLASTASLLWLVSYYLSVGPWMRIVFPIPIAIAYLRWSHRASWMASTVSGLLLAILMGPYLSIMFFVPYGLLGVQLGAMWKRNAPWGWSIALGTIVASISFFFRIWLVSVFIGEDLWAYLTGRITSFLDWLLSLAVNWGVLSLDFLGAADPRAVQLATVAMIICSDIIYLFTVHIAAWLLLERVGNPIPAPPKWVRVLLDETPS